MGFQERFASAYARELQAWVASIHGGDPAGASAWDGYAASAVCEAAWQAVRSDQPAEVRLVSKPALYADTSRPVIASNSSTSKD
jgi:myo-inositol 2-dehydrogenase/D-chiro-inositol 1-dehydrogenase